MSIIEAFAMSLLAIRVNAARSILTALGVIIGVGTFIATISLGTGAQQAVTSRVESLGTNLVTAQTGFGGGAQFTLGMAQELKGLVPDVVAAMPVLQSGLSITAGTQTTQATVDGVSEQWPSMHSVGMAAGHFFTAADVSRRSAVAVLGQTVVQDLGFRGSPVGQQIFVGGYPFSVVGVLQSLGSSGLGGNQDNTVLLPYTTAEPVVGTVYPSQLVFQIKAPADSNLVVGTLQGIFNHLFPRPNSVIVTSPSQLLSTLNATTQTLTVTLGAIAGVSLLVGGIGIMNIMLVSVTERTREIGLRKALGAKRGNILLQFLLEASLISASGGVIGIAIGKLGSTFIGHALKTTTVVTPGSVLLGFCFAAAVGVIFGLWPAERGSRLDPIVALRHD